MACLAAERAKVEGAWDLVPEGSMWSWERGICGHGTGEYVEMGQGNM